MLITRNYTRSEIISFDELPTAAQNEYKDEPGANDTGYVIDPDSPSEYLRVDNFLVDRSSNFWDGSHATSYFDGYQMKILSSDEVLIRSCYEK